MPVNPARDLCWRTPTRGYATRCHRATFSALGLGAEVGFGGTEEVGVKQVKHSLSLKIILWTALATAVVDVGFVGLFMSAQKRELRYFAALPADAITEAICQAMLDGNPRQMQAVVQSFRRVGDALVVRIYRSPEIGRASCRERV